MLTDHVDYHSLCVAIQELEAVQKVKRERERERERESVCVCV